MSVRRQFAQRLLGDPGGLEWGMSLSAGICRNCFPGQGLPRTAVRLCHASVGPALGPGGGARRKKRGRTGQEANETKYRLSRGGNQTASFVL